VDEKEEGLLQGRQDDGKNRHGPLFCTYVLIVLLPTESCRSLVCSLLQEKNIKCLFI